MRLVNFYGFRLSEELIDTKQVLIPVPVPIYVPVPMAMYNTPQPYPLPIPIPIPVPCFIPTTKNSADSILKQIKVSRTSATFTLDMLEIPTVTCLDITSKILGSEIDNLWRMKLFCIFARLSE